MRIIRLKILVVEFRDKFVMTVEELRRKFELEGTSSVDVQIQFLKFHFKNQFLHH